MDVSNPQHTDCCIAGGGPAGLMLGYLLARAGVNVIVLEKHLDFLRDFRGDTIHPSTLTVLDDLGLLEDFLKLPHQKIVQPKIWIDGFEFDGPNLAVLPTTCKFIALMPQALAIHMDSYLKVRFCRRLVRIATLRAGAV